MPYAITLRVAEPAATQLEHMQRTIADEIGDHRIVELGYPPHVTLAVLSDSAAAEAVEDSVLRVVEDWNALPIVLGGLGLFPGPASTIWAAPATTEQLLACHEKLIAALGLYRVHSHYAIGAWVPHVTLSQADQALAARAIETATALWLGPIECQLDQVDLVRFSPTVVLRSVPLAAATST
jgi:2'-5' RNA ligase